MPQPSPEAIAGARAAQTRTGIPASVSLAQYVIESGWGAHAPGNNPFGMKPRKGMNDPQQLLWTTEWSALRRAFVKVQQPFRVFPSIAAAFEAHAELISTAKVYAPAMAALPNVVTFIERMAARYATDPLYASKLQSLIASAGLRKFDA
ncbi:glucosaminidase domain-containing protein [Sphingomonas sp. CARO-RG-8B-R24-01]|uniref:glycoside hydrolase family 73 protein n=1 Tax=Sphingomonas sp. CARO-RG-8B-R24-01 TaxID=2914831 RepID=UPI001F5608E3|nr:glucosaminidase domain-containing protein [Sphingomonas sp. CARO-RG-8B-R24-01]